MQFHMNLAGCYYCVCMHMHAGEGSGYSHPFHLKLDRPLYVNAMQIMQSNTYTPVVNITITRNMAASQFYLRT